MIYAVEKVFVLKSKCENHFWSAKNNNERSLEPDGFWKCMLVQSMEYVFVQQRERLEWRLQILVTNIELCYLF